MLLAELHGYKRYLGKKTAEVLEDLINKYGHYTDSGAFALVIITRLNYVFKLWDDDPAFEDWYDYASKNHDKHIVKFLSPIKAFPFKINFDGRQINLKYCKLEKLNNLNGKIVNVIEIANEIALKRKSYDDFIEMLKSELREYDDLYEDLVDQHESFFKTYYTVGKYYVRKIGHHDIHANNVMQRPDGTLVITDPASPSESHFENRILNDEANVDEMLTYIDTYISR